MHTIRSDRAAQDAGANDVGLSAFVYGYISVPAGGYVPQGVSRAYYARLNRHAMRKLPISQADDDWPYLTRSLFHTTDLALHDHAVIHFGICYRNFRGLDWPLWVLKFEKLLSVMYWHEAEARNNSIYAPAACRWDAGPMSYYPHPKPVESWKSSDNPIDDFMYSFAACSGDVATLAQQYGETKAHIRKFIAKLNLG